MHGFGFFVRYAMALVETLSAVKEKFYLSYKYIFIHRFICIMCNFNRYK